MTEQLFLSTNHMQGCLLHIVALVTEVILVLPSDLVPAQEEAIPEPRSSWLITSRFLKGIIAVCFVYMCVYRCVCVCVCVCNLLRFK